jgi:hypothetical protein
MSTGKKLVAELLERAGRLVSWIGWHIGELIGVTVPAVVALTVTPWASLVSGVVGAGWAVHETRMARAASRPGHDLPAVHPTARRESDVDSAKAGGAR